MSLQKNLEVVGEEVGEDIYSAAESMEPELYRAASEGGILDFVKAMEPGALSRPACCIQLGPQKNTVLHIATKFRQYEIVKLLCQDLPFFVTEKNTKGDTALHIAARAGDSLLVHMLVNSEYGKSGLGEKNGEGNTALHEALCHRHEQVANKLINRNRNLLYYVNKEGKSLLYLAAEAGYVNIVKLLMENPVGIYGVDPKVKTKSPVHAAIIGRNIDVLTILWEKDQSSFQLRCERGRNPLHYAASLGYLEGVSFLLRNCCYLVYQRDTRGLFPIHLAASKGHTNVIQPMLQRCPDSRDLLTSKGCNILHVAARRGKTTAFSCMLKMPTLEKLINEKEEDGNTPLHTATKYGHAKIVSTLIQDGRVSLKVKNNRGLTARDISEECMEKPSFRKRLTRMAFMVAGAPCGNTFKRKNCKRKEQFRMEDYRDKVNIVLLVAALVATVTFTAGFTVPGGYNNSGADQGMATMLEKLQFQVFVISNTIAMYSSIMAAVALIWAQLGDFNPMHVALRFSLLALGIALVMMSIAFMASMYLVVSKLCWLAHAVLSIGSIFIISLFGLYLPLCFLGLSKDCYVFHKLSCCAFRMMLYVPERYFGDETEE